MTEAWLLLGLALALIGANALFVAAEFALVTVDRATISEAAEAGDRRARSVQKALKRLSTQLSGAQLGITVTSLIIGFIAEPSVATLLRGPLESAGLPEASSLAVALGAGLLIATVTQMIFGELVPKNWAISEPLRVSRAVAGPQRAFTAASRPLIVVLNGASNAMVRALGVEPREELASARSAQELGAIATRSATEGLLEKDIADRLTQAVEFGEQTAADVMTPRTRVTFVNSDTPVRDILSLVASTGHARFPVEGTSIDDVVGVVHFKAALAVPEHERAERLAADIMSPVRAIPSTMPLAGVLRELRSGLQLAVVIDEYGGTAGVVTLEDLVEEILGEIDDEHDRPAGRPRLLANGTWTLPGLMRPDEIADLTGIDLPEGEHSDTSGGLVIEQLGRLANPGDTVVLPAKNLTDLDADGIPTDTFVALTVTQVDGHRVARLRLSLAEPPSHEDDDTADGREDAT
ncbi:hemolysin family protein [Hoyosella altamirensis]|uniref:CBS domain containing-hemolysin-like protein n=1 Tax=Hoyosella altamirensis TaxID=616997 RepID=A0A839RK09_9ACTN|nr:hemolysin family protein [Hoyosella altamirensis]MBB3036639.1 CBS domain containing-hemolysin-like protein [Hoyosella altamirensis]